MSVNAAFQRVCPASEVAKGKVIGKEVDGTPIALVQCDDGSFHAVADECTHQDVPLSEGDVDGCTVECWLHGSRFDLRTGAPSGLPATEPVAVYPVEIRDGDIYVSLVSSNGVAQ
jgi:3-phenylpropionate/trans-cinnamate dioxygenase ferredoxin subunit